jgi:hypothetical protein
VYDDVEDSAEEHYCLILKIKINSIALCVAGGFFLHRCNIQKKSKTIKK